MIKIATVTGCAGFIGQVLTRRLLEDGWLVYGIDKLTYAADRVGLLILQQNKYFHFIEQDITTLTSIPDCDVLFNLAAESDVDTSNKDSKQFVLTNTLGVQNLLKLITDSSIIKNEPPLFIQMSTDEVYGATSNNTELFTENSPLNPGNPYAATKAGADLLITSWANTYGLEYIIIRPSNNYGARQHPEKLIPLAIKKLQRNKKIKLHNNGAPIRTWTNVEDTVIGVLTILGAGKRNTIYNISSEFEQDNITTITKLLKSYFGEVDPSNYLDLTYNRPGQDMRYAICSDKLRQLGWSARHNINRDLSSLILGYKNGEFRW